MHQLIVSNTIRFATLVLTIYALFHFTSALGGTSESISPDDGNADAGDSVTNFPNQSSIVTDKNVTFYTSYGYSKRQHWLIPFKLWVSEPSDVARRWLGDSVRSTIRDKAGIEKLTGIQKELYQVRVEDFIADSESREEIVIRFNGDSANESFLLTDESGNSKTDRNGNLQGVLQLSIARAEALLKVQNSQNGWLSFTAVSDGHTGKGQVRLIAPEGISVISDIDDTIKDTGISKGNSIVLRNTFFEPFKQVPCMSNLYSRFGSDVPFHYVSGAPWQLYGSLVEFLFEPDDGYPMGSLHMKNVRTNLSERSSYNDIWKLIRLGSSQVTYTQKIEQINQLFQHFPERKFVLIGDSGERDPEVFAEIRKQFPDQVKRLIIRDLNKDSQQYKSRYDGMRLIAGDITSEAGCTGVASVIH